MSVGSVDCDVPCSWCSCLAWVGEVAASLKDFWLLLLMPIVPTLEFMVCLLACAGLYYRCRQDARRRTIKWDLEPRALRCVWVVLL